MIDLSRGKVNKRIPKNRFKSLSDFDAITWLYKISPDTADYRFGDEPQEIQVFSVTFKNGIVNKREIAAIQKAIPYPILFVSHGGSYFVLGGDALESEKQFLDGDTLTIPKRSSKLSDLYEDIAAMFIDIERKANESIFDLAERSKRQQAIEKEIAALERKLKAEKQFDRQIEINAEIKRLKSEEERLWK